MLDRADRGASVEVSIENVGGINETTVDLPPGVSILTGRNATNRTSFLRAIMAAMGSDEVAIKADAEAGHVALDIDGTVYDRHLRNRSGATVLDGEPYLEESELLDLFAFLLETNEARRAVERDGALYDVIMRPVDTAAIEAEIDRLEAEREELEGELEELDALNRSLPELEQERTQLEDEIEAKRETLEEKEAELDRLAEEREQPAALEESFGTLRELRSELERRREAREEEQRVVDALREDQAELEAELEGLGAAEERESQELDSEIDRLREEIQSIEATIDNLQSVIGFNESMLDDADSSLIDGLHATNGGESAGAVTDQLVAGAEETIVCWTCGSEVDRPAIEETTDLLREVHAEKNARRSELREEIRELEAERKHIERTVEERRELRRRLEEAEAELDERLERIDRLEGEIADLEAELEEANAAIEESTGQNDYLELQRAVTEHEVELERLEETLEDTTDEIESIESRLADRENLEARRDAINDELESLRSRIETLETEAVEQFNEHMDLIIDVLEFENLERVWIERVETTVTEGRRKVDHPTFELHIVRENESGSVYEDTIDHLSESEREVVGLVFALSGYLVHDVHERAPFMLLDSLEALDADRISALVDYLAEYVPNLVVALLPEDAAALDDDYERITEI